jgi:WD40 repeat protein
LIRIWDLKQRVKIAELAGHTGSVVSLAYGGNVLISAGYDTTVRVWATDGELAKEPAAAQDRVGSRWEPRPK